MKLCFIFIYLCFIVSAKKGKNSDSSSRSTSSSSSSSSSSSIEFEIETSDESLEYVPFADGFLHLRGSVRRYFALEAAMLDHGRNMICSPLSVMFPLGKMLIGAKRKAKRELLGAIGLKTIKQLQAAFGQLITNIQYLPGVTLDLASKLYVSSEKRMNSKFKERTKKIFQTSCEKINQFHPREAASTINSWVAAKTRNKITKVVSTSDITRDTSLIVVNAIYFAGRWRRIFDRSFTDDFYSPSGVRRHPMMSREGKYKYWKSDSLRAQIVEIPYEGSQASMIIVLPYSRTGLPVLLRALKLAPKLLNKSLEKMKLADLKLTIPKFKIESELDLTNLYKKIGLRSIFDTRNSGLSGIMEDEEVFVSTAIQKAIIEVNERGAIVASATAGVMKPVMTFSRPEFKADRPFLFNIVFYKEQLFSGVYYG